VVENIDCGHVWAFPVIKKCNILSKLTGRRAERRPIAQILLGYDLKRLAKSFGFVAYGVIVCEWTVSYSAVVAVLQTTVRRRVFTRTVRREASCWWRRRATAACGSAGAFASTSASSAARRTSSASSTASVPAAPNAACVYLTPRWTRRDRVSTTSLDTCPPLTCASQVRHVTSRSYFVGLVMHRSVRPSVCMSLRACIQSDSLDAATMQACSVRFGPAVRGPILVFQNNLLVTARCWIPDLCYPAFNLVESGLIQLCQWHGSIERFDSVLIDRSWKIVCLPWRLI